ncbi:MAG: hypothetical protein LC623_09490 [Halobacteriales archaeon]|nr:hypothetical protein [Halobacteriales archaeon]
MALSNAELLTVLGVLLVLLGVIVYNNVMAAIATRRRARADPAASWVGRHVHFEGDVVGEVVAEEDSRLLLRKGGQALAVPRSQVRPQGLDLGLKTFDRQAALADGAAWQGRDGGAAP